MHVESPGAMAAIVGDDAALRAVLSRARRVAPTGTPVLVTGESGTGKELLARALHELGPRPAGPFVAVNCGALPRELAESELFGHERGAFTGAAGRRRGWFEEASGGTLVLDEIGELPIDLQPKLLRVLETGRIRRVGGAGEASVSVRVVAMTLRNLAYEAQRGHFRADLYYRLAGFELVLPPLRRRRGDIPLLVRHFLREIEPEVGARELDPAALAALIDGRVAREPARATERRAARGDPQRAADRRDGAGAAGRAALPRRRDAGRHAARGDRPPLRRRAPPAPRMPPERALEPPPHEPPPSPAPSPIPVDSMPIRGRTWLRRNGARHLLLVPARARRQPPLRAARALAIARSTFCEKVKKYQLG